jgi:hypothetical protein
VWVPLLNLQDPVTLQRHAHQFARLIPSGPRVTHYSDPGAYVGKKYGPIIGVPYGSPAWDVYFAFDSNAHWGDTPPTPNYFEHQLGGLSSDKFLDGPRFAEEKAPKTMGRTFTTAFIAGMLSFISPCVLPLAQAMWQ